MRANMSIVTNSDRSAKVSSIEREREGETDSRKCVNN